MEKQSAQGNSPTTGNESAHKQDARRSTSLSRGDEGNSQRLKRDRSALLCSNDLDTKADKKESSLNLLVPSVKCARRRTSDETDTGVASSANSSPRTYAVIPITPTSAFSKSKQARPEVQAYAGQKAAEIDDTVVASLPSSVCLPTQVANVFTSERHNVVRCQCLDTHCAQNCITSEYLSTYGWEYKTLLQESEDQEFGVKTGIDRPEKSEGMMPLVDSGIIKPLGKRSRQHTEWSGPQSVKWRLSKYMERQPELAPKMRGILIDWVIELSEEYRLSHPTLHLAVTLIDKALACTPLFSEPAEEYGPGFYLSREMLQCLGCACTWIAAKMEEICPPSIDDFVYISDNIYTKEEIAQMEMDVCKFLKFHLHHVTPHDFAHEYLLASQSGLPNATCHSFHPMLRHLVHYLLELSRMSYELVSTRPSLIAASALFLARATLGNRNNAPGGLTIDSTAVWTATLEFYSGFSVEELKSTVKVLLFYQRGAEGSSLRAVFNKYNKAKYMYASSKTALSLSDLGF